MPRCRSPSGNGAFVVDAAIYPKPSCMIAGGTALSVKARADDLMRIRDVTASIIARHNGIPIERVFELTATDTYFEAEQDVAADPPTTRPTTTAWAGTWNTITGVL